MVASRANSRRVISIRFDSDSSGDEEEKSKDSKEEKGIQERETNDVLEEEANEGKCNNTSLSYSSSSKT